MNMIVRCVGLVALGLLVLAGCAGHGPTTRSVQARANIAPAPAQQPPPGLPVDDPNSPMPAPGTCKLGNRDGQPLPDPHCTPGAINPGVHQDNIASTVCKSGWTATVRPPTSKTNAMKMASARSYSLGPTQTGEYDHLLSGVVAGSRPVCAGQIVSGMVLARSA